MIRDIIYTNDLRPADVIKARRRGINLVDHYIVYMGLYEDGHWFTANLFGRGVQWYDESKVHELIDRYAPTEVSYFDGEEWERELATHRAQRAVGRKYHLLNFNCEHYANLVQTGSSQSDQADVAKALLTVASVVAVGGIIVKAARRA